MSNYSEIKESLSDIRSKHAMHIFNYLLKNKEGVYHKELSEFLGLSPSGLNSIIKQIEKAPYPLIQSETKGKYKKYKLTDSMLSYMEHTYQSHEPSKKAGIVISGVLLPLQRFVEECQKFDDCFWKDCLSSMAQGTILEEYPLLEKAFSDFILQYSVLINDKENGDDVALNIINDALSNPILIYALTSYIKKARLADKYPEDSSIVPDDPVFKAINYRKNNTSL